MINMKKINITIKATNKKDQHMRRQPRILEKGLPKLGDLVESALSSIGITSERVSKWIGTECGCKERKEKLNMLTIWANRVLRIGKEDNNEEIKKQLNDIIEK